VQSVSEARTVSQCSANDVIRPRTSGESRCEIGVNAAAALRTAFAVPRRAARVSLEEGALRTPTLPKQENKRNPSAATIDSTKEKRPGARA